MSKLIKKTKRMQKLNIETGKSYRADIDGLRAIAVISVVLYHLRLEHFAGGFVGVDVFFVISGYLITKSITVDIKKYFYLVIL